MFGVWWCIPVNLVVEAAESWVPCHLGLHSETCLEIKCKGCILIIPAHEAHSDQEFTIMLSYIPSLRPAWATWDPINKERRNYKFLKENDLWSYFHSLRLPQMLITAEDGGLEHAFDLGTQEAEGGRSLWDWGQWSYRETLFQKKKKLVMSNFIF